MNSSLPFVLSLTTVLFFQCTTLTAQKDSNPGMISIYKSLGGEYEVNYPEDHPLYRQNGDFNGDADASVYNKKPVYTTTKESDLKSDLSPSSITLATIREGTPVKVIDSRMGTYWHIYYNGQVGYVESRNLRYFNHNNVPSEPIARNENMAHDIVENFYDAKPDYMTRKAVFMYAASSSSSAIKAELPMGVMVKVVNSFEDDWWEIRYHGYHGFVRGEDLKYFSSKIADKKQPIGNYQGNLGARSEIYTNALLYKLPTHTTLRARMSPQSEIILEIPAHEEVKIVDKSFGYWWEIYYRGNTGFIDRRILANEKTTSVSNQQIDQLKKQADYFRLLQKSKLHLEPSISSKFIRTLSSDDRVLVIESSTNGWLKVVYRGQVGYLNAPLLVKD